MSRTLCFPKALIRRIVATRAKMPSLRNLPDELLLNMINKLSAYDAMALQQSRGIRALCDVRNRQKYHQLKFGREKYPQIHEAVLQAGLDTLLAILRTPSLGDYLRRVDLYGTGMIPRLSLILSHQCKSGSPYQKTEEIKYIGSSIQ
ncbi:hypothetical protein N7524_012155 [Penicillium chrysogenum]|jgi:hypothetical protein|nr:hypothetical protein N7524_012155 [Penicillium chrysogenum]